MDRKFFVVGCRLDGIDWHFLWYTNDSDGVVTSEGGLIVAFRNSSDLRGYANRPGWTLEDEGSAAILLDLDGLGRWLEAPMKAGIDCEAFMNSWNLFDDAARCLPDSGFGRLSEEANAAYDKLFWGCNLPAMTPTGEHFDPTWSDQGVEVLRRVLAHGLAMFRRCLSDQPRWPDEPTSAAPFFPA